MRRVPPWAWALVALAVVEIGVLALAFDPTPHNGGDNAGYLALAHSLVERGAYLELWDPTEPPHTKYPPGFPLVLAALMVVGARTWSAFKMTAAASALAAVLLTWGVARRRLGWGVALGVALVFGFSEALVYASRWILSDLPFLAFTLLALWALDREPDRQAGSRWIALGLAGTLAAYFTRSAGLPLVVAVVLALAARRWWRSLGAFAGVFAVPALWWWARGRGVGGDYTSEFWLLNPYDPGLGRVGLGGLVSRALENLELYVTGILPQGLAGIEGALAGPVGIVLAALAVAGWLASLLRTRGRSVTDLFFPLYTGLVLLWPVVWSGDRFALPLFPLILLYAASAVIAGAELFSSKEGGEVISGGEAVAGGPADAGADPGPGPWPSGIPGRAPGAVLTGVLAVSAAALLWPASRSVLEMAELTDRCQEVAREAGPWACYGPSWGEFVAAAHWSGANLPEDAAVLSRKPRIFYLLSGVPSLTFPLSPDPGTFFSLVDEKGMTHVLVDQLDGLAGRYVVPVVQSEVNRFCGLQAWSATGQGGSQLLGIGPPQGAAEPMGESGMLPRCGPDRVAASPRPWPPYDSWSIPLLSADP